MRHLKSGRKLSRNASHRHAMLANLAMSVLDKERVITTVAKAKAARSVVEHLITFAKRSDLNSMRVAARIVTDKDILKKLFSDIGPSYKAREGGYTRILKLGERGGDNAQTCFIELTGRNSEEIARMRKKKRKTAAGEEPAGKEPAAAEAAKEQAPEKGEPSEEKKEQKEKGEPAAKPKEKEKKKEKEKPKAAPKHKRKQDKKADDSADHKKKSS